MLALPSYVLMNDDHRRNLINIWNWKEVRIHNIMEIQRRCVSKLVNFFLLLLVLLLSLWSTDEICEWKISRWKKQRSGSHVHWHHFRSRTVALWPDRRLCAWCEEGLSSGTFLSRFPPSRMVFVTSWLVIYIYLLKFFHKNDKCFLEPNFYQQFFKGKIRYKCWVFNMRN